MTRKPASQPSSLPLDVFRSQVRQFKRAHIIPQFDDMFEKDAIISAIRRIDPTLSSFDANLHANIIRDDHMTTPEVNAEDISYALHLMHKRNGSVRYQFMYALKQIMALVSFKKYSRGLSYWKRLKRIYQLGMTPRRIIHKRTYPTLFGHTA